MKFLIIIHLFSLISLIENSKILAIFHIPSKSHWIVTQPLMHELINSGHEITMILDMDMALKNPPKNYSDISLEEFASYYDQFAEELYEHTNDNFLEIMKTNTLEFKDYMEKIVEHKNFKNFMKSNLNFDLIIMDMMFSELFLGFGHYFNAPIIGVSTFGAAKWMYDSLGSPQPLSYVPSILSDLLDRMNYFQRFRNGIEAIIETVTSIIYVQMQVLLIFFFIIKWENGK